MSKPELEWNVWVSSPNLRAITVHNVFDHRRFYEDLQKAARKYKDSQRGEFEEVLRRYLMYYYWSKCEWEIILDHWPNRENSYREMKVDVYDQIKLNWEPFCDYVWERRAVLRRRPKKEDDRG